MTTPEKAATRLVSYQIHDGERPILFSRDTITAVADVADRQQYLSSYSRFFEEIGVPKVKVQHYDGYKPIGVLDIKSDERDETEAILVRLPMANGLDSNQIFQVATIAASNPEKRVVAFANPSGPGHNLGRLSIKQALLYEDPAMAFVDPQIKFAEAEGIEVAHEVGYSWGAYLSIRAARQAGYLVKNLVTLEALNTDRSLLKLGGDFSSTEEHLQAYVEASATPIFEQARQDSVGKIAYGVGLLRLSNIVAARLLRHPDYLMEVLSFLKTQPEGRLTAAWGTDSELVNDEQMRKDLKSIKAVFNGTRRALAMRFTGQRHAMFNDIHLQAATILEALKVA